jgi:hypothetical protein
MVEPRRIQLSRAAGWRMPENTVKVDRSTKYGNPARVVLDEIGGTGEEDENGDEILQGPWACLISKEGYAKAGWWFATKEEATTKSVEYFRYLMPESPGRAARQEHAAELPGQNLACWCPIDHPCHADVLIEIANG